MPMATIVRMQAPLDRRSHQPWAAVAASSIALGTCGAARNLAVSRRQGDEQATVVVERWEEIADHALHLAASRPQLELLVEPAHAPFEGELDGVLLLLEAREPERGNHVVAEHIRFAPAAHLEHTAPNREDAAL